MEHSRPGIFCFQVVYKIPHFTSYGRTLQVEDTSFHCCPLIHKTFPAVKVLASVLQKTAKNGQKLLECSFVPSNYPY